MKLESNGEPHSSTLVYTAFRSLDLLEPLFFFFFFFTEGLLVAPAPQLSVCSVIVKRSIEKPTKTFAFITVIALPYD